jgi:hypothetical protein
MIAPDRVHESVGFRSAPVLLLIGCVQCSFSSFSLPF